MTVARSVGDVLDRACAVRDRVRSTGCICNVYVPAPAVRGGAGRLRPSAVGVADRVDRAAGEDHRRVQSPRCTVSPVDRGALGRLREGAAQGRRDARAPGERFTATEGVVFIGRAQEKTALFRTEKRHDANGDSYPWIVKIHRAGQPLLLLLRGRRLRPVLPEVLLLLSLQRQAVPQRQRVGQTSGREGRDRVRAAGQRVRRRRGRGGGAGDLRRAWAQTQIDALLRKWLAILPHPFTPADRAAGYRYDLSILQAEFSLTQMLDKPVSGRIFFEQVIRDNLDIGRPDQVSLIFDRQLQRRGPRPTPGRFRTRVITDGVTPSLHVDYKHTTIKQYHKEGRALRTETTINDTRDFGIGETTDQSARPAGDRLHRQPSPAARPTTQPRPDHRNRRPGRHHRHPHHHQRHPHPRAAVRRRNAPTHCYPHCSCSGATRTDSPTKTCAHTPPSCADSTPAPSPPGR